MPDRIALKSFGISWRKPAIDINPQSGMIELSIPGLFGGRRWPIPVEQVSVTDLTSPLIEDHAPDGFFPSGIQVPYLYTSSAIAAPTTLLLFRTPQRTPALRHLLILGTADIFPYTWRESRSPAGARLDGVLARAEEPEEATARLAAAGAEVVTAPTRWLQEHRTFVTDPFEMERMEDRLRRARWACRVANALQLGALILFPATMALAPRLPLLLALPVLTWIAAIRAGRTADRIMAPEPQACAQVSPRPHEASGR